MPPSPITSLRFFQAVSCSSLCALLDSVRTSARAFIAREGRIQYDPCVFRGHTLVCCAASLELFKIGFQSSDLWFVICHGIFYLKNFIYLFIFRERGREGEIEGEKHQCVRDTLIDYLSLTPNWGPGLQSRCVPWLGIEPANVAFAGWCRTHWATPVRANPPFKCA